MQLPDGLQQPFFFLFRPAASCLFDWPEPANLLVDADQLLTEILEPMELVDLILGPCVVRLDWGTSRLLFYLPLFE